MVKSLFCSRRDSLLECVPRKNSFIQTYLCKLWRGERKTEVSGVASLKGEQSYLSGSDFSYFLNLLVTGKIHIKVHHLLR